MKNIKNLFVFGILLFTMVLFVPNVYAASIDVDSVDDLSTFLGDAEGNTLTVTDNIYIGNGYIRIISGDYVIDLAGYKIQNGEDAVIKLEGGSLIIKDSSIDKTGGIYNYGLNATNTNRAIYATGGSLTIDGGSFVARDEAVYCTSNVTNVVINGGTFGGTTPEYSTRYGLVTYNDTTINGGTFKGFNNYSFEYKGQTLENTLTINNGTFAGNNTKAGLNVLGGKVIINNGTFDAPSGDGISAKQTLDNTLDLTINNATATGYYGMYINVNKTDTNSKIRIKGGTYSGEITGLFVYDEAIKNTKLSGGKYIATTSIDEDNYGGIHIWNRTADNSEKSIYTLDSILQKGYNYSSRIFKEKFYDYEDEYYTTTESTVSIIKEKTITIKNGSNGKVTTNVLSALEGKKIKLKVTPKKGYELINLSVINNTTKKEIKLTNNTFIMPKNNVTIKAEFDLIVENPETSDNIMIYIILGLTSTIGLTKILYNKKQYN